MVQRDSNLDETILQPNNQDLGRRVGENAPDTSPMAASVLSLGRGGDEPGHPIRWATVLYETS